MENGSRLAIAILVLFLAMFAFFVAFHPGGIMLSDGNSASSGSDILNWMFGQFQNTATATTPPPGQPGANNPGGTDATNPTNPANNPGVAPQALFGANNGA